MPKNKAPRLNVKCAVACHDASGKPTIVFYEIRVSKENYEEGEHYEKATAKAAHNGYGGPHIAFDEKDGPAWLFRNFKE